MPGSNQRQSVCKLLVDYPQACSADGRLAEALKTGGVAALMDTAATLRKMSKLFASTNLPA
ncbi:hypothetical protein IQ22_04112 [Pseudomonas duriflava]|uniref:Uncharacterized protein n=1 Tax=Pseudomonas duriflava TaxID=459528 RepID=A0A562PX60_9PSED|nr:hypothetical protein IQ22_04112 [Pseudomonas duriflava]